MMNTMTPTLSYLETKARHAGSILREGFGHQRKIDHKGLIDLVTDMDHRSEEYLVGDIQKCYPDHKIVAEESGEHYGEDCCVWYIDPLDGTVNYAHGIPIFSVSIAYQEAGIVQLGVVYDPMRNECFCAQKGKGAWLNGQSIRVSSAPDLDHSLLVTGFPYDVRGNQENNLDNFSKFALLSQGVRRLGSAAMDLCYVASGRLDGFWEIRLQSYDIAAGGLIAEEAGAKVTNIIGDADYLSHPQSILAANPNIHKQMQEVLNQ